ncbi:MAG: hypothetical protein CMF12_08530 [Idiomarina sp.]|uniref:hypothetical protein n=1 Tax=Idiomarina sp. TaxID=1874361 RepID=UPI000C55CFB5|nr:hypothetical protein [Idiomarina sp.]MBT42555.1 hypothetical protein [Idiomarina sp.]
MDGQHFILNANSSLKTNGRALSSFETAKLLLEKGVWLISERTHGADALTPNANVAIYLSGHEPCGRTVIATASIGAIHPWHRRYKKHYPLFIEKPPKYLLELRSINFLKTPVDVRSRLDDVSFIPSNKTKWGSAFMCGLRKICKSDFLALTQC